MNPDKLIEEIKKFSKDKLKRREDLETLLRVSVTNNKINQLEDLSFTAKYVLGLQRVLKKGSMNPEITNLEKTKKDYSDNLIKAVEQIKEIISYTSEETKNHFKKTFLELNQQSLLNLNELLEDLEWTKMYLNNQKRQQNG